MRIVLLVSSLAMCLVVSACGGGDASAGSSVVPGASSTPVLGTRAVPGGQVTVRQTGPSAFRIASDVAGVKSVEVLNGSDYASAQVIALTAVSDGTWTGSATTGTPLLVRMTMSDGAVVESAPGDFTVQ